MSFLPTVAARIAGSGVAQDLAARLGRQFNLNVPTFNLPIIGQPGSLPVVSRLPGEPMLPPSSWQQAQEELFAAQRARIAEQQEFDIANPFRVVPGMGDRPFRVRVIPENTAPIRSPIEPIGSTVPTGSQGFGSTLDDGILVRGPQSPAQQAWAQSVADDPLGSIQQLYSSYAFAENATDIANTLVGHGILRYVLANADKLGGGWKGRELQSLLDNLDSEAVKLFDRFASNPELDSALRSLGVQPERLGPDVAARISGGYLPGRAATEQEILQRQAQSLSNDDVPTRLSRDPVEAREREAQELLGQEYVPAGLKDIPLGRLPVDAAQSTQVRADFMEFLSLAQIEDEVAGLLRSARNLYMDGKISRTHLEDIYSYGDTVARKLAEPINPEQIFTTFVRRAAKATGANKVKLYLEAMNRARNKTELESVFDAIKRDADNIDPDSLLALRNAASEAMRVSGRSTSSKLTRYNRVRDLPFYNEKGQLVKGQESRPLEPSKSFSFPVGRFRSVEAKEAWLANNPGKTLKDMPQERVSVNFDDDMKELLDELNQEDALVRLRDERVDPTALKYEEQETEFIESIMGGAPQGSSRVINTRKGKQVRKTLGPGEGAVSRIMNADDDLAAQVAAEESLQRIEAALAAGRIRENVARELTESVNDALISYRKNSKFGVYVSERGDLTAQEMQILDNVFVGPISWERVDTGSIKNEAIISSIDAVLATARRSSIPRTPEDLRDIARSTYIEKLNASSIQEKVLESSVGKSSTPDPNNPQHVFIFGSNERGIHGAGAALQAKEKFGAKQGVGRGLTGRSYALPTKRTPTSVRESGPQIPLNELTENVAELHQTVVDNPDKIFFFTPAGTGLAGYTPEQMASILLRFEWPENFVLTPQAIAKGIRIR